MIYIFKKRSNILAFIIIVILFSYFGITYYKLHKEKVIYVIGMCAKENRPAFSDIKNVDHIRIAMRYNKRFYKRFQNCEVIYNRAPKAMELKYPKK
jgi:hypothetical protein